MKHINFIIFIIIISIIFSLFAQTAIALTMKNSSYIIQMGNENTIAGNSSGNGKTLSITVGETAPGLFTGTNYKVRSGFQYVHSIIPFTFSISSLEITFGSVQPTFPVDRNNFLTVSNGSAFGYQVTAQENHALLSPGIGKTIPDTKCDNLLCTASVSDEWKVTSQQSNTFGFGYRCDNITGSDCASGFTTSDYFKDFAASPSAAIVMSSSNVGRNKKVQITYRVNVSATQEAGTYSNQIQYIATPTF